MSIIFNVNLTAGNVIFRGGTKNSGNITASGGVTFSGDAENTGTITGPATFNDLSSNNGTVSGDVTLTVCGAHTGTASGRITYKGVPQNCPNYLAPDPPFKASWITSGRQRRLVVIPSRNRAQFAALGLSTLQALYGPWQDCPDNESCFAYPATYRAIAPFAFVMDYEDYPNYLEHPGNP